MVWQSIRNVVGSGEPSADQKKPWLLHLRSSKWFILSTVIMAVFTVSISFEHPGLSSI